MADETKGASLLGKVEKILRAQTGMEVEHDGEQFAVVVKRLGRGRWRITASLINENGEKVTLGETIAELLERETKPSFDEFEVALYGAVVTAVKKRRTALDEALG